MYIPLSLSLHLSPFLDHVPGPSPLRSSTPFTTTHKNDHQLITPTHKVTQWGQNPNYICALISRTALAPHLEISKPGYVTHMHSTITTNAERLLTLACYQSLIVMVATCAPCVLNSSTMCKLKPQKAVREWSERWLWQIKPEWCVHSAHFSFVASILLFGSIAAAYVHKHYKEMCVCGSVWFI